jgi:hypothetical protein
MKIGHPKSFWGGVIFAALGLLFAVIARGVSLDGKVLLPGYTMGTPARMGPGFFPFWLGVILVALGVAISIGGLARRAGDEGKLERFHVRQLFFVLGAIVLFGVLLKAVGMLLAGMILIVGAGLGAHEFSLKRSLLLGVFLVVFSALVFVIGLKLPIPLCPDLDSFQSLPLCRG